MLASIWWRVVLRRTIFTEMRWDFKQLSPLFVNPVRRFLSLVAVNWSPFSKSLPVPLCWGLWFMCICIRLLVWFIIYSDFRVSSFMLRSMEIQLSPEHPTAFVISSTHFWNVCQESMCSSMGLFVGALLYSVGPRVCFCAETMQFSAI